MKKKLLSLFLLIAPIFTFAQEKGLDQKIDEAFKPVSDFFSNIIFFNVWHDPDIPFVLFLLVVSALFFTIYFKFPNILHFKTAINVVRGKYDVLDENPNGESEEGASEQIFLPKEAIKQRESPESSINGLSKERIDT